MGLIPFFPMGLRLRSGQMQRAKYMFHGSWFFRIPLLVQLLRVHGQLSQNHL